MIDLLILNAAATWYMTGLIWFVQIVHYPLFADVERDTFTSYHRRHMDTTGWAVGPAMLVEAATGVGLLFVRRPPLPNWLAWGGLGAIVILWLSTAIVQVPMHYRLAIGWDRSIGSKLVTTNWLRTILWTARAVLLGYAIRCCMR